MIELLETCTTFPVRGQLSLPIGVIRTLVETAGTFYIIFVEKT